jgi:hypothetical protein
MRLALVAAAASSVLAQATPGVPDQVGQWLQFGVAGAVIIGFLSGKIRRGADYDQLRAENDRLRGVFEERVLPALIRANELIGRLAEERRP